MRQQDAEKIIGATEEVFNKLSNLLDVVNASCQGEVRSSFQHAIGVALAELDLEVLGYLHVQFPDLAPPKES